MQRNMLNVKQAAASLKAGMVIAYPTEAVYGLGCDPANEQAVRKILALKNRSQEAGLILISDRFEHFESYIEPISREHLSMALATWPGPTTWLFPRAPSVPDYLAGKHPTIALRVTAHSTCRLLCSAFGGAIVSSSANIQAAQPATTPEQVTDFFADEIDGIVEGCVGDQAKPSEIRDLFSGKVIRAA